jgi:hypothetical protein
MGGARAVPRRPREGGANPPFTFPPWANIQEFFSSSATYIVSIPTIRGVVRLIFTHLVCLCVYNASHVGLFGKEHHPFLSTFYIAYASTGRLIRPPRSLVFTRC